MGWLAKLKDRFSKETETAPEKNRCPRCEKPLRETKPDEISTVVVDICPKCFGLWFEEGELDRLDGSAWVNVEDHPFHSTEGDHPPANCPKCLSGLDPVSPQDFWHVILDRCNNCAGFWLDAGELDRVQELARHIDHQPNEEIGEEKPAGWSDLRWMIVKAKRDRD